MAEENNSDVMAESSLLEQEPPSTEKNAFDEQPIGGGSKFQFSEFPSENDEPPARKTPPPRKPAKPKKE